MQRGGQRGQRHAEDGAIQADRHNGQGERTERPPLAISEVQHDSNLLLN